MDHLHIGMTAAAVALSIGAIGSSTKILVQSILAIAFTEALVFYVIFLVK